MPGHRRTGAPGRVRVGDPLTARLIILCGLPGSGKSTVGRRLAAEQPLVRFCPDEWLTDLGVDLFDEEFRARLERRMWALALDLLRLGQSVVIEFGSWTRAERDEMRLAARAHGVRVELRFLDAPLDVLIDRVADRSGVGTVPIDRVSMEHYATLFQPPTPAELALFDAAST